MQYNKSEKINVT